MERDCGHRVHVRLGDVFDDDRDVVVPGADSFVIRSCDEPSILVDKCDRIYRTQVLVIFLSDFTTVHIILQTVSGSLRNEETGNT